MAGDFMMMRTSRNAWIIRVEGLSESLSSASLIKISFMFNKCEVGNVPELVVDGVGFYYERDSDWSNRLRTLHVNGFDVESLNDGFLVRSLDGVTVQRLQGSVLLKVRKFVVLEEL